jgi:two-component system response regulator HydG
MSEHPARVLVVDDDRALAETLSEALTDRGYAASFTASSTDASRRLETEDIDALVTDLRMPNIDGLDLLALSRRTAPERPVIVMTAFSAVDSAVESIRRGAYHYLTKPFRVDELALFLGRALDEAALRRERAALERTLRERFGSSSLVGESSALREVCELAERVASASSPALILGETGTGKGLVARMIHAGSARAAHPFVTLNCAAMPEQLLESELFGHVKGAFTGATSKRGGLFEEARGGTLFLDEIGEMPLALQPKLLDVIERGVVRAVGSDKEHEVDVRLVAATHRDLHAMVRARTFREDLLFRLDVVTLEIPPLRHRREDLPALIAHFLKQARAKHTQSPVTGFSPDAIAKLLAHSWPGNVRELENAVERAVVLGRAEQATAAELPATIGRAAPAAEFDGPVVKLADIERRYARWALEQLGGRKLATAEKLDIDRRTLAKLLGEPSDE